MSANSKIEWCDSTFNPWIGCTKVGPGCDHCYAEADMDKRLKQVNWGAGQERKRTSIHNWRQPEKWNNTEFFECNNCGLRSEGQLHHCGGNEPEIECPKCKSRDMEPDRRRVFCASLSDWLDNEVPIEWLVDLLDLIRRTPNIDWLQLTKRIGNWRNRMFAAGVYANEHCGGTDKACVNDFVEGWMHDQPPANVWIGATVVNQAEADRDIPKLLQVPARVRFISIEPMLGPIDLRDPPNDIGEPRYSYLDDELTDRIHWVICGGESGPKARPMNPSWAREIRDQCEAAHVPFLFKQWGEWLGAMQDGNPDHEPMEVNATNQPLRVGKKAAGRLLNGREWNGYPGENP